MGFLDPEEVLNKLSLKSDMMAGDFGSGPGGFTIPLAKRLEDGIVNALDVQVAPLSALKSHSLVEKLNNIRFIRCNLEKVNGSTLSDSSLDLVLLVNILFQIDNKTAIIVEAYRVLKKGGKLLVVDWLPESSQGPKKGKIDQKEIKKIIEKIGFKLEKEFEAGKFHYGMIFSIIKKDK
ncbi:MAG: class I SAM-dependent methyltransferase [Candidatus Nealsonbacteria bacterium]